MFPWLYGTKPTLLPVYAVGQQGLSDFNIEARQPGLRFDGAGFSLAACAWSMEHAGTWKYASAPAWAPS